MGVRKAWGSRLCSADDVGRTACSACVERPPSPSSSTGAVGLVPPVRVATSVVSSPLLFPARQLPNPAATLSPELSGVPLFGGRGAGFSPHLSSALLTQVPAGDPEGFDQTLWLRRPAKPLQRRARWIKPSFEEEAPA